MALFRRFFYRKPPEGLVEVSDRVYVLDCCFSTDVVGDDKHRDYVESAVTKMRDHWPDGSFAVFSFIHGQNRSQIAEILSEYDVKVMEYHTQHENCPLLAFELIHHFLISSESWLDMRESNILLLHCEPGCWPVLAFALAALLIYRKHCVGEQRTLDMVYKYAPPEFLQLVSEMNPVPSQLRYLQYVSERNLHAEWLPRGRFLVLRCIVLRGVSSVDAEGGCHLIFRIYGLNPVMEADQMPKMIYSTPKGSNAIRHYKQADCDLARIEINCHIKGDVMIECIKLDQDRQLEEVMFRIMFNTAFIKSNMLSLSRDEVDTQWHVRDHFSRDFKAETLFSEIGSTSLHRLDLPVAKDEQGSPSEASHVPNHFPTDVDRQQDVKDDVERNMLSTQDNFGIVLAAGKESLDSISCQSIGVEILDSCSHTVGKKENQESFSSLDVRNSKALSEEQGTGCCESLVLNSQKMKTYPEEPLTALRRPVQSKILSPRINSVSASHSFQESLLRYPNGHSPLGITALLQDTSSNTKFASHVVTISPKSSLSASIPQLCKPAITSLVTSLVANTPLTSSTSSAHTVPCSVLLRSSICSLSPPRDSDSPQKLDSDNLIQDNGHSEAVSCPAASPFPHSKMNSSLTSNNSVHHLPPQPVLSKLDKCMQMQDSFTSPLLPPDLPPSLSTSNFVPMTAIENQSSVLDTLDKLDSSTESLSYLLRNSRAELQSVKSVSDSKDALESSPSVPLLAALSSNHSPSCSTDSASSITTTPQFSDTSSSSQISLAVPEKILEITSLPCSLLNATESEPSNPPGSVSCHLPERSCETVTRPPQPPPPPPSCLPKQSLARIPPPTALPKVGAKNGVPAPPALPKVGAKNGVPAPPALPKVEAKNGIPAPPSGAKCSLQSISTVKLKRLPLKPYHWLKLTRAMQGSLWAETQKSEEAAEAPEFDIAELESLFSATVGDTKYKSKCKSEKVNLIDFRRAYNCEIMLTKIKIPLPDIMSSVLSFDDSRLDADQIESLIKFCPTKDEMELLKSYKGDTENLGKCEQFFLEMMKVPRADIKFRVFSFKIQFNSRICDLRGALNIVNSASEEVRSSIKLKRVMQSILSLGNVLNHGTARGSAIGFRLDSLLKLSDTRARNNKMTLLHYLCKVLAEKLPELIDFPKELMSLEAATKIQLKHVAEEMQAITKGLEKVSQELLASENDGPVSENFCKMLRAFLHSAQAELRSLVSFYPVVGKNADALAQYFNEDPARCPFEQVISTLLNFVRMFTEAHEENRKQLELEKKRAKKDAVNEKVYPCRRIGRGQQVEDY